MGRLNLNVQIEQWPLKAPFRITGYTWEQVEVLLVTLERDGRIGRGEAAGVYYRNDTPALMLRLLESVRRTVEVGISRTDLQKLLPQEARAMRSTAPCGIWKFRRPAVPCGRSRGWSGRSRS